MKVKYLQEKIKDWNPNDDIVFCEYDYSSEAYTRITKAVVKHCRPRKKKYYHKHCANYEMVNVKDSKVGYHYDSDIVYCLECDSCSKGYTCKGI